MSVPLDYISLEELEKDIHDLKSYTTSLKADQDVGSGDVGMKSRKKSRIPHIKKGYKHVDEEGDVAIGFAKAKTEIENIKDELAQDYFSDMSLLKSDRFSDKQRLRDSKGVKRRKEFIHLPNDETASDYPRLFLDKKSGELSESNIAAGYPGKLADDSATSEYSGQLADGSTSLNYRGKFPDGSAPSEYSGKMPTDKASSMYSERLQNAKAANKITSLESRPHPFESRKNKDVQLRHQLDQSLATRMEQKEADVIKKGKKINSHVDVLPGKNASTSITNLNSMGNVMSMNKRTDLNKTQEKTSKIDLDYSNYINWDGNPFNADPDNLLEEVQKIVSLNPDETIPSGNIRKNGQNNKTVVNQIASQISSNDHSTPSFSANNGKPVAHLGKHTFTTQHNKQADAKSSGSLRKHTFTTQHNKQADAKSSGSLRKDSQLPVSVEKRRGNNAEKYSKKKKQKTHRKQPKPQPQPPAKQEPAITEGRSTTEQTTTTTTHEKINTILVSESSRLATQNTTNLTMYEVIDSGVDKINIPLSGAPPWHTLIHGRRDIVLAGAVMGGIGILLIILSIVYMCVNRRSRQRKVITNSKSYQRLGSTDEKARLTEPQRSLFSSSSTEDSSEESDEDVVQRNSNKKKAAHY